MGEQLPVKGFTALFEQVWHTKKVSNNLFIIRYPGKQKLLELTKFEYFNMLGTSCRVDVLDGLRKYMQKENYI
jgi:hypothetical protein